MSQFSLEETLKSVRFVYRIFILLSAATIMIWLSKEEPPSGAIDQLRVLSELDYQEFERWSLNVAAEEIKKNDFPKMIIEELEKTFQLNKKQLDLIKRGLDQLLVDLSHPPSFSVELPPKNASISDLYKYYKRNPVIMLILPDRVRTIKGYKYATQFMIEHETWKDVEIKYFQGKRESKRFRIYVKGVGMGADTGNINHVPEYGYKGEMTFYDWLQTKAQPIKALVNDIGDQNPTIFPAIDSSVRNQIQNKTPEEALSKLEADKKEAAEKSSVNIFGLSIPFNIAAFGLPLIGCTIAIYLWISATHLSQFIGQYAETISLFPWLGLVAGRHAFIIFVTSILALPIFAFGGLIFHLWGLSDWHENIFGLAFFCIMISACIATIRETYVLRSDLNKLPRVNNANAADS